MASIIVYFIGLLVSFISLCIICDDYLIPSVEVFIIQFRIPEEVAGSNDMIWYDIIHDDNDDDNDKSNNIVVGDGV